MSESKIHTSVVIIGGGPVGLFLSICLAELGVKCKVLEKRLHPVKDSRSLGIHPASLDLFDKLNITRPFLEQGLKVKKGLAFSGSRKIGEISFAGCPPPHNYILLNPQYYTEQILRDELKKRDPDALILSAHFSHFQETEQEVEVHYEQDGVKQSIRCHYLVGCDGSQSLVREQADITYLGKRYQDTYIMGDFPDHTPFGADAAVFLPKNGLIECFPLPDGMRRWVVKTDQYIAEPKTSKLATEVNQRIGIDLNGLEPTMLSSFGVQHFIADTFVKGRILLAGDAAHVVSPIGGQGMNLGWINSFEFAQCLAPLKEQDHIEMAQLISSSDHQRKTARKVAKRAEMNMLLGRKRNYTFARDIFLKTVLNTPLNNIAAKLFTMRGLDNWWI